MTTIKTFIHSAFLILAFFSSLILIHSIRASHIPDAIAMSILLIGSIFSIILNLKE